METDIERNQELETIKHLMDTDKNNFKEPEVKHYIICYDGKKTNPPIVLTVEGEVIQTPIDLESLYYDWSIRTPGFDLEKVSFKRVWLA